MKIAWRTFTGESPRIEPHLLPDNASQLSINTKIWRGALEPFRTAQSITTLAKAGVKKTIHRFGKDLDSETQHWFHWPVDVDVTRSPIPDDTQERTYYTEAGQIPRWTDSTIATTTAQMPSQWYDLGYPQPPNAPTVSVTGAAVGDPQSIAIGYSYVGANGEEGPISQLSALVDYYPGQTLNLSNLAAVPIANNTNTLFKRIYVSQTDAQGQTAIRFWADISVVDSSTSGTVDFDTLGERAPEPAPEMPPDDLFGLLSHPNGFLVGFSGKRICRSEAFKPYAWPSAYRDPVADDIVGGAALGQSVVVCTRGSTYIASGNDPLSQNVVKLEGFQPCVAKRTIRVTSQGVVYASPDGLVNVTPTGAMILITASIMTRDDWQAFKPEAMHAAVHDDRYFCWFDTGTSKGCLIFDFSGEIPGLIRSDIYATAAFSDFRRDALFVALESGNNLYKWDAANTFSSMTWKSKKYTLDRPQNFSAGKVVCEITGGRTVTFRLYADGVLKHTQSVTNALPFRMPANYRAREYEIEILGTGRVKEVIIAGSVAELT